MDSRYAHADHEEKITSLWNELDVHNPDTVAQQHPSPTGKSFCIIMPPPNANDPLHIGHAMFIAIEDVLIRYHRMLGDDTLWLPGTDHAGIETQFVFEKKLSKQGKSRFQFDRQTLYDMIWEYVQENSGIAVDQMKRLGASADWSRFCFTLDPEIVTTVHETFFKLHKEKLVYRDLRLVNFCTKCGTGYSELEVNYVDQVTPLYYVRYYLADKNTTPETRGEYLTLATVRPEPIFADTHLAVNPNDSKNKKYIKRSVYNPLTGKLMPIIADEFVDPEFGTGIVKLTPAHDANDFAVAKKHNLPIIQAIDTRGKITPAGGKYAGLSVQEARKQVVADLESSGHIEKIDTKYANRIGTCYRCARPIEPLPLPQFFIKVKPLADRVLTAMDNKDVRIHGAGRDKILRHWLENLHDWNISRQIVWGIRLPIWYRIDNPATFTLTFTSSKGEYHQGTLAELLEQNFTLEEIRAGLQTVLAAPNTEHLVSTEYPTQPGEWLPETDTFDTWFSSGQWPFATLKNTKAGDFERFYPTQVMETGYDILPFWVMRMLMLGLFSTDQVPFTDVYLHGLVRDEKGQKMSKSKGNVTNPLEVVGKYGADALRMALVIRSTPGADKSVGEGDFTAMRNFTNKLWNAARFVILAIKENKLTQSDPEYVNNYRKQLAAIASEVTTNLDDLKPGLAAELAYNHFWHWFCDEEIEAAKAGKLSAAEMQVGLSTFLQLLHPFVPFVTEAIWQELRTLSPTLPASISVSAWPKLGSATET